MHIKLVYKGGVYKIPLMPVFGLALRWGNDGDGDPPRNEKRKSYQHGQSDKPHLKK
ncbi:MAG: hypothetical protein ABF334_08015 [Akkermansiaceae bacterium]